MAGPMKQGRTCADCGTAITRHSKSGKCMPCRMRDPDVVARRTAGIRAAYKHRPELLDKQRKWMGELNRRPESRARSGEIARRVKLWEKGLPNVTAESHRKQGKAQSDRRLADIPPSLRDDYRKLLARGFLAVEARQIIADQHAHDVARRLASGGGA